MQEFTDINWRTSVFHQKLLCQYSLRFLINRNDEPKQAKWMVKWGKKSRRTQQIQRRENLGRQGNSGKHKSEWAEVGILLCMVKDYSWRLWWLQRMIHEVEKKRHTNYLKKLVKAKITWREKKEVHTSLQETRQWDTDLSQIVCKKGSATEFQYGSDVIVGVCGKRL